VSESSSPKFQRYSSSWKGLLVEVAVVLVASKKTESGATPDSRLASAEIVMAALPPLELLLDDDGDDELEDEDELEELLLELELVDLLSDPPPQPVNSANRLMLRIIEKGEGLSEIIWRCTDLLC
jgi:hypothetical protein